MRLPFSSFEKYMEHHEEIKRFINKIFHPIWSCLTHLRIPWLIWIEGQPGVIWMGGLRHFQCASLNLQATHMALRISKTRTKLPWSAVRSSCSSSGGGPACIRGLNRTGRTCWWMLKWRCCYISPSKRCQRGCSNAASPLQSPSSRYYITMAVI